jgi:hypothetical protein
MTAGEINTEASREVHPLKSIGCFIKKPITAKQVIKSIRADFSRISLEMINHKRALSK